MIGLGKTGEERIQKRMHETETHFLPDISGGFEGILECVYTYIEL